MATSTTRPSRPLDEAHRSLWLTAWQMGRDSLSKGSKPERPSKSANDSAALHSPLDGWFEPLSRRALGGFGRFVAERYVDRLDHESVRFIQDMSRRVRREPRALDLACGTGAQAGRMAVAGARVVASDLFPEYSLHVDRIRMAAGLSEERLRFEQLDLRALPEKIPGGPFDVISVQRSLHHLRFGEAVEALKVLRQNLMGGGRIYLSVAGLPSELSEGYSAADVPVEQRFALVHPKIRDQHDIRRPVCLYSSSEVRKLMSEAGFETLSLWISRRGHIKAIGRPHGGDRAPRE